MTDNVKRFSDGFVIYLPPEDLDMIIGNTLEDLGYSPKRREYGKSIRYTISDERGDIARIIASPLTGKRFECRWFGDDTSDENAWRRAEAMRIEKAILRAVWKQQNTNELLELAEKRMQEARRGNMAAEEGARGWGLSKEKHERLRELCKGLTVDEVDTAVTAALLNWNRDQIVTKRAVGGETIIHNISIGSDGVFGGKKGDTWGYVRIMPSPSGGTDLRVMTTNSFDNSPAMYNGVWKLIDMEITRLYKNRTGSKQDEYEHVQRAEGDETRSIPSGLRKYSIDIAREVLANTTGETIHADTLRLYEDKDRALKELEKNRRISDGVDALRDGQKPMVGRKLTSAPVAPDAESSLPESTTTTLEFSINTTERFIRRWLESFFERHGTYAFPARNEHRIFTGGLILFEDKGDGNTVYTLSTNISGGEVEEGTLYITATQPFIWFEVLPLSPERTRMTISWDYTPEMIREAYILVDEFVHDLLAQAMKDWPEASYAISPILAETDSGAAEETSTGYGIRMSTVEKIERLMKERLNSRGKRKPTRKQAYGSVAIDSGTVKRYVPAVHAKWDDWDSGWEGHWEQLVDWEEIKRNAN